MYSGLLPQQRIRNPAAGARGLVAQRYIYFMRLVVTRAIHGSLKRASKCSMPLAQRKQTLQLNTSPMFLEPPSLPKLQLPQQTVSAIPGDDYRIYQQNIDLEAFFGETQKYDKVSDVCLLNDHFILVKMPQLISTIATPAALSLPREKKKQAGSKLPRCFKCNRGSRVSPILEELEDNVDPPWVASNEVEVFETRTKITTPNNQNNENIAIDNSRTVIMEQPQSNPAQLQLETQRAIMVKSESSQSSTTRSAFHWFLWPFRRRAATRTKYNAAVHKTYFVRWNKPPEHKVELRRSRSAVF